MSKIIVLISVAGMMLITACAPDPNDMSDYGRYKRWKHLKTSTGSWKSLPGESKCDELNRIEREMGWERIKQFQERAGKEESEKIVFELQRSNPELLNINRGGV